MILEPIEILYDGTRLESLQKSCMKKGAAGEILAAPLFNRRRSIDRKSPKQRMRLVGRLRSKHPN